MQNHKIITSNKVYAKSAAERVAEIDNRCFFNLHRQQFFFISLSFLYLLENDCFFYSSPNNKCSLFFCRQRQFQCFLFLCRQRQLFHPQTTEFISRLQLFFITPNTTLRRFTSIVQSLNTCCFSSFSLYTNGIIPLFFISYIENS